MSSGKKRGRRQQQEKMDDGDDNNGDPGSWECTVCTFRNRFEAFKCEMCDTRKGTSTRKPRLNQNVVEQQQIVQNFVVQQSQVEMKMALEKTTATTPTPTPTGSTKRPKTANGTATESSASPTPLPSGSSRLPPTASSPSGSSLPSSRDDSRSPLCPLKTPTPRSSPPPSSSASSTPSRSRSQGPPPTPVPPAAAAAALAPPPPPPPLLKGVDRNSARTLAVTVKGFTVVVTDYKRAKAPKARQNGAPRTTDSPVAGES